jgi:hypothetical protein
VDRAVNIFAIRGNKSVRRRPCESGGELSKTSMLQ